MKIIKLSTPWNHNYNQQFADGNCILNGFKFEINNDCEIADYWVIWGGVESKLQCNVKSGEVFYITDEAYPERRFNNRFLNQFDKIIATRTDLNDKYSVINNFELTPWYFNKSYNELNSIANFDKTKKISIISSDLTLLPGHKKRYAFVNKMIGHFKDRIDVYGRGFNEIPDKFDALSSYKYSIAIENNVLNDYFTEKISECFLTETMPIYYGCPNIHEYYDTKSIISIDIDNYKEAIDIIEKTIESNTYELNLKKIIESKERYLSKFHFAPALIAIISNNTALNTINNKRKIIVKPEREFEKTKIIKQAIKQIIKHI